MIMSQGIRESDWKMFRELWQIALECFCSAKAFHRDAAFRQASHGQVGINAIPQEIQRELAGESRIQRLVGRCPDFAFFIPPPYQQLQNELIPALRDAHEQCAVVCIIAFNLVARQNVGKM